MGKVLPYRSVKEMETERLLKEITSSLQQEGATVLVIVHHPESGVQSFCNQPLPQAYQTIISMLEISKVGLLQELGAL